LQWPCRIDIGATTRRASARSDTVREAGAQVMSPTLGAYLLRFWGFGMSFQVRVNRKTNRLEVAPVFHEREFVYDDSLVFVIMPFGEPWSDRVWEHIKRIIADYGMSAERADNRHGPVVTEDIWRGIVEARVVLADVTGWNPNVFYELGIAHTLGKDVVLMTQPSARLPFDTQGFRHIIYSDNPAGVALLEDELPKKLDHFLKTPTKARRKATATPSGTGSTKQMLASWLAVSGGWEPELPAMETGDARSRAGALRKQMFRYAHVFSEDDAKRLVADVRNVWPDEFSTCADSTAADAVVLEATDVVNRWRAQYAQRAAK
jgi:hypothetical protein